MRRHCGWRLVGGDRRGVAVSTVESPSPGCSTPCGVTAVGGWANSRPATTTEMCSTPCGVTAVGGPRRAAGVPGRQQVLNALRRHCGWRETPSFWRWESRASAQRLAASLRLAERIFLSGIPDNVMCSTPCGVTAVGGARRDGQAQALPPCAQRLAASLRLAAAAIVAGRLVQNGAQRLAASLRLAVPRRNFFWPASSCSTPCGVTAVGGAQPGERTVEVDPCSTPCGVTAVGGTADWCEDNLQAMCSTPCGVTAVGGVLLLPEKRRPRVLNALRRHCGWRPGSWTVARSVRCCAQRLAASLRLAVGLATGSLQPGVTCSTPCGVTAVGGRISRPILARWMSAQRLAASLRLAEYPIFWLIQKRHVLNALRRHCGWRS